jgi:hypothetical protein
MLVIHGFVAPTTARKSNMTVAGRSRPKWEMAGRQGSFRARAMPDAVLSQGRAEREGGGGCPRGEGVRRGIHCNSALAALLAALLQCGRTVDAASFPVVGPIRKNNVPRNRVQAGQDSPVREHCTFTSQRACSSRPQTQTQTQTQTPAQTQTQAQAQSDSSRDQRRRLLGPGLPPSSQVVMLRAGLREGSPASAGPVSSVVAAPGPG